MAKKRSSKKAVEQEGTTPNCKLSWNSIWREFNQWCTKREKSHAPANWLEQQRKIRELVEVNLEQQEKELQLNPRQCGTTG